MILGLVSVPELLSTRGGSFARCVFDLTFSSPRAVSLAIVINTRNKFTIGHSFGSPEVDACGRLLAERSTRAVITPASRSCIATQHAINEIVHLAHEVLISLVFGGCHFVTSDMIVPSFNQKGKEAAS